MKLLALSTLFPVCLLIAGCRSSDAEHSDPASAAASSKAAQARAANAQAANSQPTNPQAATGPDDPTHRSSGRAEEDEADRPQPDHYEGGDPRLYNAPIHRSGSAREKVEKRAPSTPTPTPHAPIYRPLDAAGQPVDPKN